ncbi:MAG: hypothetical protein JXA71_04325 [Chitinispirillaceae bacterium]|nr:hypothetical protein [Chitinispirillaceae bacterium]
MQHQVPAITPEVAIVHDQPCLLKYLAEIVSSVLALRPRVFSGSIAALDWFYQCPATVDLVIVREQLPDFDGFHLLKGLDATTPRPVHAIFLIEDKPTAADAENWFYDLDKTFSQILPLKAVRYPWFKHHIATALVEEFPWCDAGKNRGGRKEVNLAETDN